MLTELIHPVEEADLLLNLVDCPAGLPGRSYSLRAYGQQMNTQLKTADSLGLTSVLVGSLPDTLMTDAAPERYTVEAVLSRKAQPDEVTAIEGAGVLDHLMASGYPTIQLRVSDRRLVISNTNLEELRDGLGAVIAAQLERVSGDERKARERAASDQREASEREHERAKAVVALASSVSF